LKDREKAGGSQKLPFQGVLKKRQGISTIVLLILFPVFRFIKGKETDGEKNGKPHTRKFFKRISDYRPGKGSTGKAAHRRE
jgi:hypothetical protein